MTLHFTFFCSSYVRMTTCVILLLSGYTTSVVSQEVQEIRPLSFGKVVVLDNNTSGRIIIDQLGNVQLTEHFAIIEPPEYGIVRLTGFPPNAQLNVNAIILQSQMSASVFSPEQFTLVDINTIPLININSDGTDELRFGGEIVTSGSGSRNFVDAKYSSTISITFNY